MLIIFEMPDGAIVITAPHAEMLPNELETDYLDRIAVQDKPHPDAVRKANMLAADLPVSKDFRDCWRHDGSGVVVDAALETAARWSTIRGQRDRLLDESDKDSLRLGEQGGDVKAIHSYRQKLREVPQKYSADPLTVVWPVKP